MLKRPIVHVKVLLWIITIFRTMERLRRFFLPAKRAQGLLLNIYLRIFFYDIEIGLIISSTNQNYETLPLSYQALLAPC